MITVKQMRQLEREAQKQGIFATDLMGNAGREVARAVEKRCSIEGKRVVIFCGTGSNGGDGLVTARHLAKKVPVIVFLFGEIEKMGEATRQNYERIKEEILIVEIRSKEDLEDFRFQQSHQHVFIDALLGVGIVGEARDPYVFAIEYFNSLEGEKVAIDVPSGLNADTGQGSVVTDVDLIVTLHDTKPGLEQFKEKVVIVDIGLDR